MNVPAFASLDNAHLSDQVKMRLISQLTKDISRVLQKLHTYFNDNNISTSFVPTSAVLPINFCVNLNEELLILTAGKSAIASLASKNGLFL